MELLDKYGNIVEQFKLENVIAIHCYDDCNKSVFRLKNDILKSEKIYEIYKLQNDTAKGKTCEKLFLVCCEKEIKEILVTNFISITTLKGESDSGNLYINDLFEIETNGLNEVEVEFICIKKKNDNININYFRSYNDGNIVAYPWLYPFKITNDFYLV